jgi:Protein of unknown function (DUF2800)
MKTKHSLISPSNFERRILCPGSLNAEKDLPETTSIYAEEGTMLHERTSLYIDSSYMKTFENILWNKSLSEEQIEAIKHAGDYFNKLKDVKDTVVVYEAHEKKYSLSFIYPDMKGTADSVLMLRNIKTNELILHVIDYKFGKGVVVDAFENYQLLMYAMGALVDINSKITGKLHLNLHIVQPYIRNSSWELTESEQLKFLGYDARKRYIEIANDCHKPDAPRIASKKACQWCKAKPTCPTLAKFVPNTKTNLGELSDEQIATIYDNKDLITMYVKSVEEHIKRKLEQGSFMNYALKPKLSNRKWNDDAYDYLVENLSEEAFEVSSKLITITKAEKLLGKKIVNKLTIREEGANEIVKISDESKEIFKTLNDN